MRIRKKRHRRSLAPAPGCVRVIFCVLSLPRCAGFTRTSPGVRKATYFWSVAPMRRVRRGLQGRRAQVTGATSRSGRCRYPAAPRRGTILLPQRFALSGWLRRQNKIVGIRRTNTAIQRAVTKRLKDSINSFVQFRSLELCLTFQLFDTLEIQ